MATAKPPGVTSSTSNSNQTGRNKDDLPTLKNKVAEVKKFFLFSFIICFFFVLLSLNVKLLSIKQNWMNYVVLKLQQSLNLKKNMLIQVFLGLFLFF